MPKTPRFDAYRASSSASSRAKRANRREGGVAERLLRSTLWKRGLRYRKHVSGLPGQPDIVFHRPKLCVFVDGDFWHGRNWPELADKLSRRANADYWIAKISRNMERDVEQTSRLTALGWRVLRLWETDILKDPGGAAKEVEEALLALRRNVPSG